MNQSIKYGYNKIFWGFVLILIDIRFNRMDIIPDFIGYFYIWAGLNALAFYNKECLKTSYLSIVLLVLSFNSLFTERFLRMGNGNYLTKPFSFVIGLFETALHLVLIFQIIQSIIYFSKQWRNKFLENSCYRFLKIYMSMMIMLSISLIIMVSMTIKAPQAYFISSIISILIELYLLYIIYKAKIVLSNVYHDYNLIAKENNLD
jgi:hypothetical protein